MINRVYYRPVLKSERLMQLAVSGDGETMAQPNGHVDLQEIYDKLYDYEQSQAEGLIIKLPVKIGTPVYYLSKSCDARGLTGLLHGTDLSVHCPFYNQARGVCMKQWEEASHFDHDNNSAFSVGSCERDLDVIDLLCVQRMFLKETTFQYHMTNEVIKIGETLRLDGIFISQNDAMTALAVVEQQLRIAEVNNTPKKAKYF